ncbi:probable E3 ubiquitin-protein ligase XERICO [Andrographis paniculata]|uniref:probable E3 ubiquitin-protein ligase XERICO n=1 Tax=Andrographis paniculata TaxID=175694 RepID=UPI0021E86705|nr:probable E3 ubiquitin-protein ligase XERICO [Andrographis paniculata]
MAISSFPAPADAGVLCLILANAAASVAVVKGIIGAILGAFGVCVESPEVFPVDRASCDNYEACAGSYVAEFRKRAPAIEFELRTFNDRECSICLMEFEAREEINCLPCRHVFHSACIDKWLLYWHATCPLCRDRVMPDRFM